MSVCEKEFPEFFVFLGEGKLPIDYDGRMREFSILIPTSSARQILNYCPWSGKKFPASLRDEFCDLIEAMGLEPFETSTHPSEFNSEEWWLVRRL